MSIIIISLAMIIVLLCAFVIWFVWVNAADSRLIEMISPVAIALMVAILWTLKLVYTNIPEKTEQRTSIINIEYAKGGQLPIIQALLKKPFEVSNYQLWLSYMNQWNQIFLNKRQQPEDIYKPDPIHFEFFEFFVLKAINERFGLGWNHDAKMLVNSPSGKSGTESYGVSVDKLDKINLRALMDLIKQPNAFVSNDKANNWYQIAVPKGTKIDLVRSRLNTSIVLAHKRFRFAIGFSMSEAIFEASAFQGMLIYPFYEALFSKFRSIGSATSIKDIRQRMFTMHMEFDQNIFTRFSMDADLDKKFAENLWRYFQENLSWPQLEKWYQEAAFSNP